jgi:hypothetical protein
MTSEDCKTVMKARYMKCYLELICLAPELFDKDTSNYPVSKLAPRIDARTAASHNECRGRSGESSSSS